MIRHTTRLLAHHKCVIIPGMGALLAHDVPAFYNAEEHIFIPPHRALGFNPQITVDDSLLVSEYMAEKGLSYEDAAQQLSKETGKLNRELSRKGEFCFGCLGTFHMDINGGISFTAADNSIDDPYNFGFEPLAIQPLSEIKQKEIVIKRRDLSRYVAVAVAAILTFFFVTPVSDSAYEPGMQASMAVISPKESIVKEFTVETEQPTDDIIYNIAPVEDTVTENIITVTPQEENIATAEEIAAVEEVKAVVEAAPAAPVNSKTYSIIVASSPNAKNAQLAIKELSARHDAAYSVVEGSGRHRISVGDYPTSADAANALSEIKNIFPDAWVLTH